MKKLKRTRLSVIVLTLIMTLLVSACGSNQAASPSPNASEGGAATQAPAAEAGGTAVVVVPQDPDSLDPHLAVASGTSEMMFNVFEGLLKPNEKGEVYPALAESYEVSADGLTYTFKIRKGVKFHNGNPMTVDDVKYSYERLMGKDTGKSLNSAFANVASVETPDDATVVLKLKKNDMSFSSYLTAAILPKGYDNQNKAPIGTGPFKFVEFLPSQRLVIEKNKDYYVKDIPHLDKVEFRIMPDGEAAMMAFKAGEIDMYPRIDSEKAAELGDGYTVLDGNQNMVQLMTMNMARKPFDDVRVRKAINYAIDTEEIIKAVAFGKGTKLGSNFSPAMAQYFQPGLENTYNVNIEEAKKLLAEAGYKDGFTTTLSVPSNYKFHVNTGQVIAEQLKKVGIEVKIELVEWAVWLDRIYKGRDYDMTITGLTGKLDPHEVLGRYASDYKANFFNFNNAEYDALIKQAQVETDNAKRTDMYKKAQTILTNEAAAVYIMDPNFTVAMKKNMTGYKMYPLYIQDMSEIRYTK
jgi:peptide/nickel transport system substrate-binding protein